ncbi:MAG: DUF58 domain-containing protein [Armatimonadota bacterium]
MTEGPSAAEGVHAQLLASLSSMELRARAIVEGHYSGQHRSPYRGASVEFADHRQYTHGDELRHLDWRLYGRTDRFFVKQYEAETNLTVHLLLDASGSMDYPERGVTKLTCASWLAAGLAYVAWRQRDAVGLTVFDSAARTELAPRTRRGHLHQVFEALERVAPGGESSIGEALESIGAGLQRRGLVVVLSDLLGEPRAILQAVGLLRGRGHDVIVMQVLARGELHLAMRGPRIVEDLETGQRLITDADEVREEYEEAMRRHVERLRDGCARHGVDHELFVTDRPFGPALVAYLARRRRRTG